MSRLLSCGITFTFSYGEMWRNSTLTGEYYQYWIRKAMTALSIKLLKMLILQCGKTGKIYKRIQKVAGTS